MLYTNLEWGGWPRHPRRKHHLFFTVLIAWRRVKFDLISCGAKETPFVSHVLFKKMQHAHAHVISYYFY